MSKSVNFKLTLEAKLHLKKIAKYTKEKWGSKQRDKYLAELDHCYHSLSHRPYTGKDRSDINPGYRSKVQGSHVIFYTINELSIEIIGIHHVRDDLEAIFCTKKREASSDNNDDSSTPK